MQLQMMEIHSSNQNSDLLSNYFLEFLRSHHLHLSLELYLYFRIVRCTRFTFQYILFVFYLVLLLLLLLLQLLLCMGALIFRYFNEFLYARLDYMESIFRICSAFSCVNVYLLYFQFVQCTYTKYVSQFFCCCLSKVMHEAYIKNEFSTCV